MRFLAPDPYRQTFRLLEAFLALIWVGQISPQGDAVLALLAVVGVGLLVGGQFWSPLRPASWFVGLASSFATMVIDPWTVLGPILGLCAVYMIYNTDLLRPLRTGVTVSLAVLLVAAQLVPFVQFPVRWLELLTRDLVVDLSVAVLLRLYRPLVASRVRELPDLELTGLDLNVREMQLLGFVQSGLSQKEMAVEMGLTHGTLRHYLSRVYAKTRVTSFPELVRLVSTRKLVFPIPESSPALEVAQAPAIHRRS